MSIDVSIQNFRCIRESRLLDENGLSIIIALNEGGKSSLIGAIQYAMTGSAFGRKMGATVEDLVTHGEQSMSVRVLVGNTIVSRSKTTGDTLKSVAMRLGVSPELLPLMFDAKMCGDGGSRAFRAFLDGVASSAFDALTHFSTDPPIYELVLKARGAGKLTTKAIIEYCESMRAGCKTPTPPVMPGFVRPTEEAITAARAAMNNTQITERLQIAEHTDSLLLGQKLSQLIQYKYALAAYEKQRAAASTIDPLKERRQPLQKVVAINVASIQAVSNLLGQAGYVNVALDLDKSRQNVAMCIMDAQEELAKNPTPASMPTPPQLDDAAFAVAVELGAPAASPIEAVGFFTDGGLRTLLLASATQTNEAKEALIEASRDARKLEAFHDDLNKQLGAWQAYDRSVPLFEEQKLAIEASWSRWDIAAKTIAAAETAHVNASGDVFGQLVSDFSASILQGRKIRVSRDEGIFLGIEPISDCSESTRWRVEVAVMAAIGVMLKSPLLLIDGADVLDPVNKLLLQNFLLQNIVPRYKHVICTTTTSRRIEEEQPAPPGSGVSIWTIDRGVLKKL